MDERILKLSPKQYAALIRGLEAANALYAHLADAFPKDYDAKLAAVDDVQTAVLSQAAMFDALDDTEFVDGASIVSLEIEREADADLHAFEDAVFWEGLATELARHEQKGLHDLLQATKLGPEKLEDELVALEEKYDKLLAKDGFAAAVKALRGK